MQEFIKGIEEEIDYLMKNIEDIITSEKSYIQRLEDFRQERQKLIQQIESRKKAIDILKRNS